MSEQLAQLEKKGGSGDLYKLVKEATVINAGTGSNIQSFPAEIGKRYLIISTRISSAVPADCSIETGAIVDTTFINNIVNQSGTIRGKIYVAIATATASTIKMGGSGNMACYMPLDN